MADGETHETYQTEKITISGLGPVVGDIDTGNDITIEAPNGWRFHIADNGVPHLIRPDGTVLSVPGDLGDTELQES
jgi:hypothetical protein